MKIAKQVCSLEQAKKLKELGVAQGSVMVYYESSVGVVLLHKMDVKTLDNEWCAFTVAEMSEILETHMPYWIHIWGEWGYKDFGGQPRGYRYLAEACAARLINLLENKIISIEECNLKLPHEAPNPERSVAENPQ